MIELLHLNKSKFGVVFIFSRDFNLPYFTLTKIELLWRRARVASYSDTHVGFYGSVALPIYNVSNNNAYYVYKSNRAYYDDWFGVSWYFRKECGGVFDNVPKNKLKMPKNSLLLGNGSCDSPQ